MEQRAAVLANACVGLCSGPSTAPSLPAESADSRDEWYFDEFELSRVSWKLRWRSPA